MYLKRRRTLRCASSSSSVYGEMSTFAKSEDTRPLYGVTKVAAEQLGYVYRPAFAVPVLPVKYFTVLSGDESVSTNERFDILRELLAVEMRTIRIGSRTGEATITCADPISTSKVLGSWS